MSDLKAFLADAKEIVTLLTFISALIVVGWALFRLPRILEALKHFNELRTPIWDLRSAVESLKSDDLKGQLDDLKKSVEAAQKQLSGYQRQTADERAEAAVPNPGASPIEDKWDDIRDIWAVARDKLEKIIERIPDGRVKRKYDGIARYNYTDVNNTLRDDGLITEEAAVASQKMNDTFLKYRRRSSPVTKDVLENFKQWQKEFDRGIARR
jgi:hypothetical protein